MICDESSRCKNSGSQRSEACQRLADMIREQYGLEHGYVIEMSGTPSPKSPVDWWSQCEIAWPGFLREGSAKAMEERLAFMVQQSLEDRTTFKKRIGWKDDETKCAECGETREAGPHELDGITEPDAYHPFKPSKNEVAYLYERLKGLVTIKHKKDCLQPARQALPQDHLPADREYPARGRGHRAIGPQCHHRHDAPARVERRFPVPRRAGRHDALHALHGWDRGRLVRPGQALTTGITAN